MISGVKMIVSYHLLQRQDSSPSEATESLPKLIQVPIQVRHYLGKKKRKGLALCTISQKAEAIVCRQRRHGLNDTKH